MDLPLHASVGREIISIFFFALAAFIAYFFLASFPWGAGFEPTPIREIRRAADMLDLREGILVYDLGSGSGRAIIEFASSYNVRCVGVEIDPLRCSLSRVSVRLKGLSSRIVVLRKNLLKVDLSKADAVFVFLSEDTDVMKKLQEKILKEMRPGAKIASYVHKFPSGNLRLARIEGQIRVYEVPFAHSGA